MYIVKDPTLFYCTLCNEWLELAIQTTERNATRIVDAK
jgi:hypothetical protein